MLVSWFLNSSVMFCENCQKHFATKYTFKRHMQQMHPAKEMDNEANDQELESDNETNDHDQESGNENSDIFEYSQSENECSDESMEQTDSGSETEEQEEPDFWTLIIRNAVQQIQHIQKTKENPGFNWLQHITEKPLVSQFINILRKIYYNIEQIHEAGNSDPVLEKIENELEKMKDTATSEEEFEEEAQEMAWIKYKPYIKKKILQNLEEFKILNSDADNEGDSENDSSAE